MDVADCTDKFCRTCLTKKFQLFDIFENSYNQLLFDCTSVQVQQCELLPKVICTQCVRLLKKFYAFKLKCQESNEYLMKTYMNTNKYEKCILLCENLIKSESKDVQLYTENRDSSEDASYVEKTDDNDWIINKLRNPTHYRLTEDSGESCDAIKTEKQEQNDSSEKDLLCEDSNSSENYKTKTNASENNGQSILKQKNKFECDICGLKIRSGGILARHKETHFEINPRTFECKICYDAFYDKKTFHQHVKRHNGNKQHVCPKEKCPKRYRNIDPLIRHIKTKHKDLKPLKCELCSKTFTLDSQVQRHMKVFHNVTEKKYCSQCGEAFSGRYLLKLHEAKHLSNKPYPCTLCDKSFASPYVLRDHVKKHNGETVPPVLCNICGKQFVTRDLKKHLMVHSTEQPFECTTCGKRFKRKTGLTTHQQTHTGERRYFCPECGNTFTAITSLKNHLLIHRGVKPFECTLCHKRFRQRSVLKTHMKVH